MKTLLLAVLRWSSSGLAGLHRVRRPRPALARRRRAKKPITHDVYDSWKSIQGTKLSADGVWLAYALTPQDGDGELVVRNLKTSAEIRALRGRDPLITLDSRFVVYAVAPLKKDVDAARKAKKKPEEMPKAGVGIVNLSTGQSTTVAEHVKSFRVPDDVTPQVVVYLAAAEPAPRQRPAGTVRRDRRTRKSTAPISSSAISTAGTRPRSRRSASTRSTRTAPGWSTACRRRRRPTKARSCAASPTAHARRC